MPLCPPDSAVSAQSGSGELACVIPRDQVVRLRNRSDFLKLSRARRAGTAGFLLQARKREAGEAAETIVRVGFTCSKKIGNAVTRNRAKRRLRAVAGEILPTRARPGWDYVLVGRVNETILRNFNLLCDDLKGALKHVHQDRPTE